MFNMLLDMVLNSQAVKRSKKVKKMMKASGLSSVDEFLKTKAGISQDDFGLTLSEIPADAGKKDKKKKKKNKTNDAALVSATASEETKTSGTTQKKTGLAEKMAADKVAIETGTAVSSETA